MWVFRRSRREERGEREGRGKEERGGGEGGSRVLDISDGHWASVGPHRIGRQLGQSLFALHGQISFMTLLQKMYVFQLKDNIFSPNRTLMLAGS